MIGGGAGSGLGIDRMLHGSQGMQINRMLDALGLPDQLGDMIGAQIDAARGDWAGYARNMMDLTSGMSTSQLDGLFGKGLPGSQFVPRPHEMLPGNRSKWGGLFHTPFGRIDISQQQLGGKGWMGRMIGRSMEKAILTNPAFKQRMERILGGRIIPDGRADGKITVLRYRPNFPQIPFTNQIANNPMLSGMYGALARMENNIKNLLNGITGGANAATGTEKSGGTSALDQTTNGFNINDKETRELAQGMGMDMSALSFEDMLFLMMMKYARKKEKEILSKMNELSGGKAAEGTEGARRGRRRRGYGGALLGGLGKVLGTFGGLLPPPYGMIAKAAGGFMSGVANGGGLSGGLKGALGGVANGMFGGLPLGQLSSVMGGAGGLGQILNGNLTDLVKNKAIEILTNPNTSDTLKQMQLDKLAAENNVQGGASGMFGDANKTSDTLKQMQLQKLMEDLKKMYEMLSNVMKSMTDMQMAAVRNLR